MADHIKAVAGIHEPNQDAIEKLRELLAQAEKGEIRGIMFAAVMNGECAQRYGHAGYFALDTFALGVKLLDVTLTEMIEGESSG